MSALTFSHTRLSEDVLLKQHIQHLSWSQETRENIVAQARLWVDQIRQLRPNLFDAFMAEYGLSNHEGIALMQLAEALLRVPDAWQKQHLIKDKIAVGNWQSHTQTPSTWVNWASKGLAIASAMWQQKSGLAHLSQPAMTHIFDLSMRFMGHHFVMAQTIDDAVTSAKDICSFDMLGEAALTGKDAHRYFLAYRKALLTIAKHKRADRHHGLSVKLSALSPHYSERQVDLLKLDLLPRLTELAELAAQHNIGLTVDAEETERLALSLDVFEYVLQHAQLEQWSGFGLAVQAYNKSALAVIDHVYQLSERYQRPLCVRLVKGAYWDREIKHAQVLGLDDFPVYTDKAVTDIAYLSCAKRLLSYNRRLFAQFATHNAHTLAAIEWMAEDNHRFEYQRLFGMGEQFYEAAGDELSRPCRVYAPVGSHTDLLAYLVRRLLENGANANFVNLLSRQDIPVADVVADPFTRVLSRYRLTNGNALYAPARLNSMGLDLDDVRVRGALDTARAHFQHHHWSAKPLMAIESDRLGELHLVINPADNSDVVGSVRFASLRDIDAAIVVSKPWSLDVGQRAKCLNRVADLLEQRRVEIFSLLVREAGKTLLDAHAELREAVDFLRYYASTAPHLSPLGRVVCISPWNFPLAICCGQIAAALACGNAVLAKPAEQTCLVANVLAECFYAAGVPAETLQVLPGLGDKVGARLCGSDKIHGVVFTGSHEVALHIRRQLARNIKTVVPLIAETGGINAMIVDSTAHLEQAVQAIIASAFQSAGQRCSALRCVYVQEDIYEPLRDMLIGAMDCLQVGNPWQWSCDVGPVIDATAQRDIQNYIETQRCEGKVLHQVALPHDGYFCSPTLLEIDGIESIQREIFGPVLHIACYAGPDLERVIRAINDCGYGLTFGLHTRLSGLMHDLVQRINVGNIYINRNQIGAIVESQPFGGEGLSGTGPKAGGPHYLRRLCKPAAAPKSHNNDYLYAHTDLVALQLLLASTPTPRCEPSRQVCPGPTGESNSLYLLPRDPWLCMGPGPELVAQQVRAIEALGGVALACDVVAPELLALLQGFGGVLWWGDDMLASSYHKALAARPGAILPLLTELPDRAHACVERHVCIDTTAAGGNVDLLRQVH